VLLFVLLPLWLYFHYRDLLRQQIIDGITHRHLFQFFQVFWNLVQLIIPGNGAQPQIK
jgi:hypothetical protein